MRTPQSSLGVAKGLQAAKVLLDVAALLLGLGEGLAHLKRGAIPQGEPG